MWRLALQRSLIEAKEDVQEEQQATAKLQVPPVFPLLYMLCAHAGVKADLACRLACQLKLLLTCGRPSPLAGALAGCQELLCLHNLLFRCRQSTPCVYTKCCASTARCFLGSLLAVLTFLT